MSTNRYLGLAGLALLVSWPLAASAQNTPVKPSKDLLEAIALDVPIDPATRVDPAAMPRDLAKETARSGSEIQITLDTAQGARYLVDCALDSAEQEFAVVTDETRTTQAPQLGHLAVVLIGNGPEQKVRVLPLGDANYKSRRFTLFQVTVTPIS